jgi:hypothetical protein
LKLPSGLFLSRDYGSLTTRIEKGKRRNCLNERFDTWNVSETTRPSQYEYKFKNEGIKQLQIIEGPKPVVMDNIACFWMLRFVM